VSLLNNGEVGIGTDSPTQKLEVAGTLAVGNLDGNVAGSIMIADADAATPETITLNPPAAGTLTTSYTLTLPPDDGDAGEQLQTNGAGVLTWEPAGSGSVTMSGAYDYITLSGQDIVRGQIDLATDVTGDLPLANLTDGATTTHALFATNTGAPAYRAIADGDLPDTLTASNYLPLTGGALSGALTYTGVGQPKRTVVLTAAGAIIPASNAPQQLQTNGTNVSFYTLNYSGTAGAAESANWQFIVPDSYTGSTVNATLYWLTPSTTTSNVVKWFVDMNGFGDGQTLDAAMNAAGTVNDSPTAVANQVLTTTEITNITSGWSPGELAVVRVQRNAADAADTETALAKLLMIRLEWTASAESD
jgi:hypothetical protein